MRASNLVRPAEIEILTEDEFDARLDAALEADDEALLERELVAFSTAFGAGFVGLAHGLEGVIDASSAWAGAGVVAWLLARSGGRSVARYVTARHLDIVLLPRNESAMEYWQIPPAWLERPKTHSSTTPSTTTRDLQKAFGR